MNNCNDVMVNDLVLRFQYLLNQSWVIVSSVSEDPDFTQNWFQANWELVLEGAASHRIGELVVLEPYGEGAEDMHYGLPEGVECYDRVSMPTARPTHTVVCRPRRGTCIDVLNSERPEFPDRGLVLSELVAKDEIGVESVPPFDLAMLLGVDGGFPIVEVDALDFFVQRVNN